MQHGSYRNKVHIATHNDDYIWGGFKTYSRVKYHATVIDTYRLSRGMSRACPREGCLDNNALHSANVLAPPSPRAEDGLYELESRVLSKKTVSRELPCCAIVWFLATFIENFIELAMAHAYSQALW